MIGDRIKQARLAAGLTLAEVAEKISAIGGPRTRAALSNYEKNKRNADAEILVLLGRVLGIRPSYFLAQPSAAVKWKAFRCQTRMPASRKEFVKAYAQSVAERHMYLQQMLPPDQKAPLPRPKAINVSEQAEEAAERLRESWGLGHAPIESVTQTIENQGGIVVSIEEAHPMFDGLSGLVDGEWPVVAANAGRPDDRIRFDLAHELGHLLLDCVGFSEKEEEKCAHRFAGAFLIPRDAVRHELGVKRSALDLREIGVLKQKYGVSMQALLFRAWQSGVIGKSEFDRHQRHFAYKGWKKREPVEFFGSERPTRLKQMALRAVTEGLITPSKAEELCPGCTGSEEEELLGEPIGYTAEQVLRMPRAKRSAILRRAAELLEKEYRDNKELTAFEAFGEDDLHG